MHNLPEPPTVAGSESVVYARQWSPLLVIISGPSGVGKDTVLQCIKDRGYPFAFITTMTTRPRRESEVDGKDYLFVSHETFLRMIDEDELLEHSLVYGDYKGVPKQQVRRAWESGLDVIMRVDVQGAAKVRAIVPQVVSIILVPESEQELVRRLTERRTETPEGLSRRIATARDEMTRICEFDYVVVNAANQVQHTVDKILAIISAEHCRVTRTATCL